MNHRRAVALAIDCIEREIKRLADMYHNDAPMCVEASRKRKELREAIAALRQPQQVTF